jgi:hypothetical protein
MIKSIVFNFLLLYLATSFWLLLAYILFLLGMLMYTVVDVYTLLFIVSVPTALFLAALLEEEPVQNES